MPYVCRDCNHFEPEAAAGGACPECGGVLRLTMLDPRGASPEPVTATAKPAWHDPLAGGYEEIEAPWSFRYAQIGVGVATYCFLWRVGAVVGTIMFATALSDHPSDSWPLVYIFGLLALRCIAAIVGGAAAGMWARNWIPQGLGVACGILAIPLLLMLVYSPESWPFFLVSLAITSVLSVFGAFIGHLVVKPTRIPLG